MSYDFTFTPQGWQCPVCKRVYSPSTSMCMFCGGNDITTEEYTTSGNKTVINPPHKQKLPSTDIDWMHHETQTICTTPSTERK